MGSVHARFPGLSTIERASYVTGHGITPGSGQIEFNPSDGPPRRIGMMVLSDGTTELRIPDCIVTDGSVNRGESGLIAQVSFVDRRWKWAYGEIYGSYNLRDKEGEIIPDTKKTPAELAKLLLEAMGEQNVDTSALPAEPFPEVEWDGDVPADELADLLDDWGCRIGLDFQGKCRIWKAGVGAAAPQGAIERDGANLDPPEAPDFVRVNFGPTTVSARLELEAVGRETDGSIKPIDELSYKPESGWSRQGPNLSAVTGEKPRVYALQSVFRWYRVKLPDGGLTVPGISTPITDLKQILPLHDEQVESYTDPKDLEKKPKPVKVYGFYFIRNTGVPKNSTRNDNWECKTDFRVLGDLGILAFQEQVVKFDEDTADDPAGYAYEGAELFADIAFPVADLKTRAYHRYSFTKATGSKNGTGPEVTSAKSEGGLKVYQKRKEPNSESYEWAHAKKGSPSYFDGKAEGYIEDALARFNTKQGRALTYGGIVPVPIDGFNVQASFSVGRGGAETQLSQARETSLTVRPYEQRRREERARRLANREKRRGGPGARQLGDRIRRRHQGER